MNAPLGGDERSKREWSERREGDEAETVGRAQNFYTFITVGLAEPRNDRTRSLSWHRSQPSPV